MASLFQEKFQKVFDATCAKFVHGISPAVVAELESIKPGIGNLEKDDACLRAWKKIEKVMLLDFVIYSFKLYSIKYGAKVIYVIHAPRMHMHCAWKGIMHCAWK